MQALRGLLGVVVILALCAACSRNLRAARFRLVACGLLLQAVLALFLATGLGERLFDGLSWFATRCLEFSYVGSGFVFGSLGARPGPGQATYIAFHVLPIVIYFAALMAALYHLGIMQVIVYALARLLWKVLGVSGAEATSIAADVFVGMTESPLAVRPYLETMTRSELMAVMTGGLATIAGTVFGAYVLFVGQENAKYLIAASLMAAPAALVTAKLMVPETETPVTADGMRFTVDRQAANLLDAITQGARDGLFLALNIAAMLIAFYALVALVNWPLGAWFDITLQEILGVLLTPFAWCLGVPWEDAREVGTLLGTKVILNEWIAYADLQRMMAAGTLGPRAIKIATFALCGFANLGSMGVIVGGIAHLAPSRRAELARLALPAMAAGTLATCLTAAIAGMFAN
jgi:CNT family concentrative nucleoside transporter